MLWRRGAGDKALRILHLLPTLQRRGAQVFAADLCCALRRAGVSQRLAVLAPGVDEVGIGAGLREGELIPLPGGLRGVVGLRGILRDWRPDVLFAHGGEPLPAAFLARSGRGEPVLIYRKIGLSDGWLRKPRRLRLRWHRWLAGSADAVAAVGAAVAQEAVALLRVPRERIRVIRQGVDPVSFSVTAGVREEVRAALGVPPSSPVLLAVGALSWEKHQEALLRALVAVRGAQPQTLLLIAGEGPERRRLERLAAELGVAGGVRLLGTRADVPALLAAADVFLLASLTEGLPGVLIEAGMAGVPAVAWDVAGVREVIRDGNTGLVPAFGDEQAFAAAVLRLLGDPAGARRLGAAARAFCRERFSIDRCAEEHLQLFRDVLERRR